MWKMWSRDFIFSAISHANIGCIAGYPMPSIEVLLGIGPKQDVSPILRNRVRSQHGVTKVLQFPKPTA